MAAPGFSRLVCMLLVCCYLSVEVAVVIAKKHGRTGFSGYLPSEALKAASGSNDDHNSQLSTFPTALLQNLGETESRLPEPLIQSAMLYYTTLPESVDPKKLRDKLGAHFDEKWMAIERPFEDMQDVETVAQSSLDPDLLMDLRELNFSYTDEQEGPVDIKPPVQKVIEKWLLQKASCPVKYKWADVGPFFWPHWIKKGICSNEKPCSWPPGMHCVAEARPMTIRILRWHCRPKRRRINPAKRNDKPRDHRKNRKQKQKTPNRPFSVKCRWRKVRYPITTRCYCTC